MKHSETLLLEQRVNLMALRPIISDLSHQVQEALEQLRAPTADEPSTPTNMASHSEAQKGRTAMNDVLRPNHYFIPLDGLNVTPLDNGDEEALNERDFIQFDWWGGEEHNPTVWMCSNSYSRTLHRSIVEVIIQRLQRAIDMTYDFATSSYVGKIKLPVTLDPTIFEPKSELVEEFKKSPHAKLMTICDELGIPYA